MLQCNEVFLDVSIQFIIFELFYVLYVIRLERYKRMLSFLSILGGPLTLNNTYNKLLGTLLNGIVLAGFMSWGIWTEPGIFVWVRLGESNVV